MSSVITAFPITAPLPPVPSLSELSAEEQNAWNWMMGGDTSFDTMVINLTPRLARLLIERVGDKDQNRKLKNATMLRYSRAMATRQWMLTHQGIAVSTRFQVIDGQHRLHAVVQAQTTIEVLVVRGVSQDSMLVLDNGIARTDADAIRISDVALNDLEPIEVSSAKRMIRSSRRYIRGGSRADIRAFIVRHREPIRLANRTLWQAGRVPNITSSDIVAVLARASYHCAAADVQAAADFLATGKAEEIARFEALLLLREWLIRASGRDLRQRYGKAERAMRAFIDGEKLGKRLTEAREELFRLPEERLDDD